MKDVGKIIFGVAIGSILSAAGIVIAAQLPSLTNFDSGKILQSADLKAIVQAVSDLQDQARTSAAALQALQASSQTGGRVSQTADIVVCCSRTVVTPPNTSTATVYKITATGGGAGGAAATGGDYSHAGAGGSGGTVIKWITGLPPGTPINITIGQGGAPAQRGGDTIVTVGDTVLTAYGGHAFEPDGYGSGGDARGGDLNIPGSDGTDLFLVNSAGAMAAHGGGSYWGGAAGSGAQGHAYGAGGGGGVNGGAAGKEGVVLIEFNI
ncbi:MAG: hypothetical protein RLZZ416_44 [Candidatus Parcubacteria bacterium]|jgi:hypothetical protein